MAATSGDDDTPIAGATASSYTTPALTTTTSYWVRVSNAGGRELGHGDDPSVVAADDTTQPSSQTREGRRRGGRRDSRRRRGERLTGDGQRAGRDSPPRRPPKRHGAADDHHPAASQTIASGQTATMSVAATGTAPLTYQWYVGTSGTTTSPIAGATASSYTTPALTTTTSYWVRVSNPTAPRTPRRRRSASAAFTAAATGSPAPAVRWQVSAASGGPWTDVAGATSTTLTFAATAADHGKWFRAVFTNGVGQAASNAATLAVRSVSGSDFNGDGTTDLAVDRPATGEWFARNQPTIVFGGPGHVPVAGDYDGDGATDPRGVPAVDAHVVRAQPVRDPVRRPRRHPRAGRLQRRWARPISRSIGRPPARGSCATSWRSRGSAASASCRWWPTTTATGRRIRGVSAVHGILGQRNQFAIQFGGPEAVPAPGDYNGDGAADSAFYRPGDRIVVRAQPVHAEPRQRGGPAGGARLRRQRHHRRRGLSAGGRPVVREPVSRR